MFIVENTKNTEKKKNKEEKALVMLAVYIQPTPF